MKKLYEIGVGNPNICRAIRYRDCECYLFEANPNTFNSLRESFGKYNNFYIYNFAIADYNGKIKFSIDGDSSYISDVKAPTIQNASEEYINSREIIEIDCRKISEFDHGDIDILLLDMEGSEWFVLKHLISRPSEIVIEMGASVPGGYVNPYSDEIMIWMMREGYRIYARDQDDIIFIKNENP